MEYWYISWFIGTKCVQSERINMWHLHRRKKNEINRGRNSYSMLHQRVDDTLGTNRSRTLNRHLLLVLPWYAPLLWRIIISNPCSFIITVPPIALVFDVKIVEQYFRTIKYYVQTRIVQFITNFSLNIIDLHSWRLKSQYDRPSPSQDNI